MHVPAACETPWRVSELRPAEIISIAAFVCFVLLGWLLRLSWRQQRQLIILALVGSAPILAIELLSLRFPSAARYVGDWVPMLWILVVYWQSGRFNTKANKKLQCWLERFDRRWIGHPLALWERGWEQSWFGGYLEFAYLFCGPLLPLGVAVLYLAHLRSQVDAYWVTVMLTSDLCYLVIPFAMTLPPRLVQLRPEPKTKLRRFNHFILGRVGIQLNTLPSAHVASSVAVSLVLLRSVPAVGVVFLILSLSIAAGAVLGRYHYLPDVVLGALLPIVIAFFTLR